MTNYSPLALALDSLQSRMSKLEAVVGKLPGSTPPPPPAPAEAPEDDDDDFDLFGSEEESEDEADNRAAALAKYNEKKSQSK